MRPATALAAAGGIVIGVALGAALFRGEEAPPAPNASTEEVAPAGTAGEPSVQWKLAAMFPRTLVLTGEQGVRLIDRLAEISGGDIVLKYYEPGALVPGLEIFDAVSSGAVDAGWASPGFWAGKVPALQFFTAVPFGPEPGEFLGWIMYGGGRELYEDIYRPHDIHPLICNMTPRPRARAGSESQSSRPRTSRASRCASSGWARKWSRSSACPPSSSRRATSSPRSSSARSTPPSSPCR